MGVSYVKMKVTITNNGGKLCKQYKKVMQKLQESNESNARK